MPVVSKIQLDGFVQMEAGGFSSSEGMNVSMTGSCFLNLNGFEVSRASFNLEGNCTLHAFLSADKITMISQGPSVVRLGGRAGSFDFISDGPSRLDGSLLLVDNIRLDLKGKSEIRMTPDVSMKIRSTDKAVIYYSDRYIDGIPEVEGNAILRKF